MVCPISEILSYPPIYNIGPNTFLKERFKKKGVSKTKIGQYNLLSCIYHNLELDEY